MKPTNRPAFSSPPPTPLVPPLPHNPRLDVYTLPSSPPRPHTPPRIPAPPSTRHYQRLSPLVPLSHPPFTTSLTPLPRDYIIRGTSWSDSPYHMFVSPSHSHSPSISPYHLLSFSFPLSISLFLYTRASHIADSSHTVAEVDGLRASGALRDLRGSSFFFFFVWDASMDRIEKGNGRSASFSDISDVRVVGIAMIIRDQFTCQSSTIGQLITVRGGM